MKRYLLVFPFIILLLLIGCAGGKSGVLPLQGGAGTAIAESIPSTATRAAAAPSATTTAEASSTPTVTASPLPPTIDPTYFIFPTNTPTATLDPSLILMRIVSPGPMSKVVSPIEFIAHIAPDYTGTTRIEMIGEDGVELYRKVFKTYSNIGYFTRVDEKINFEINGAAEMARLQISTLDGKGRLLALNSVRLLLQSVGDNLFTPPYDVQDRTLLRYPKKDDEISGGTLAITGEFKPANNLPVILDLLDDEGNVLGSRLMQLRPSDGKYQQFTTDIPYQVKKKIPAMLVIHQADDRIDGLAYLFSMQLKIGP